MMTRISNPAKAEKMLAEAQERAHMRLLSMVEIEEYALRVRAKLMHLMDVQTLEELRVSIQPHCGSFPASYRGRPESTSVFIEFTGAKIRVISIDRVVCDAGKPYWVTSKPNQRTGWLDGVIECANRYLNKGA